MNFLITGGAGFIGSHLTERLLKDGHNVAIIDDLSTGSVRNIMHLRQHPKLHCVIDTMMNTPVLAELVDAADVIFHLAAAVGVKLIVESPARTIETNIQCTERVLAAAAKKKKPVIITSTSEVYGKSTDIPFREDGDLVLGATSRGRWSYACSKAIDEFLALAYFREKRLPTIVVRLFNTVGPRQTAQYGMVVPRFVSQALADRPLTVFGDGQQSRCFTHVGDVIEALIGLQKCDAAYGEVFNIGHTEEITILGLAEKIRDMVGSSSEITFVPYDQAYEANFEDMSRRVPSLNKIKGAIGWEPSRGLNEILESVIEYTRSGVLEPVPA
ncbi:MAG TPA: GDP-mannose 4,6-dehydratase [Gemmatimonadaceae bacterium]|nr:GDP-mannose 4,6-dehydratase [Gemmatimonadaceae bacterium]